MRPAIVDWLEDHGFAALAAFVPTPGVVYGIAVAALLALFVRRRRSSSRHRWAVVDAALWAGFGAWIGASFFPTLQTGNALSVPPWEWLTGSRGTASWGAYLGGLGGLVAYARLTGAAAWQLLDTAASCAALGPAIARFACLLAGDDFGRPTSLAWGIVFPPASLPFDAHVRSGLIDSSAAGSLPVHPLQICMAANALAVFLVVSWMWRLWQDRPGRVLGFYLLLYGVTRFCWEFLRDPEAGGASSGLSVSQGLCIAVAVSGAMVLVACAREWVNPSLGARVS